MFLTFEDCVGLCDISEAEALAIAEHQHIPPMAAVQLGDYLVQTPAGERYLKVIIRDDIAAAAAGGDRLRERALKAILRDYVLKHPSCDERARQRCADVSR